MIQVRDLNQREIWRVLKAAPTLPHSPNFSNLPRDTESAVNLMITLINQANYLIGGLIISSKEKYRREGGLTEEFYRKRREYRGY